MIYKMSLLTIEASNDRCLLKLGLQNYLAKLYDEP